MPPLNQAVTVESAPATSCHILFKKDRVPKKSSEREHQPLRRKLRAECLDSSDFRASIWHEAKL